MKTKMILSAVLFAAALSAFAGEVVPIRFENRGLPVQVKQFRDGVQCDLSQLGRGIQSIGYDNRFLTRRQLDRDLVAGEPVEFVFVRKAFKPARTGIPTVDARGLRTRLVPEAGMEYRVRIAQQSTQLDAIVEARPQGTEAAFERVPTVVSYDPQDLCVTGVRGSYAAR